MLNPTSDSAAAPPAAENEAAATRNVAAAPHPLAGADWGPLAAALHDSLADHGYPLPPGLAIAIVEDVWKRMAAAPAPR